MQPALISPFHICLIRLIRVVEKSRLPKWNNSEDFILFNEPIFKRPFQLSSMALENLGEYLVMNILVGSLESWVAEAVSSVQGLLGKRRAVFQL